MRTVLSAVIVVLLLVPLAWAGDDGDFLIEERKDKESELDFIGYYFMRQTMSNMAPTNEFLKGQVVGRLFGGNTTRTSERKSLYGEQRFMPMFTYSPRLFDGWAKMRASFELDWTWGDANYGAGGNFGGAFGADFVNMQTQNLFVEFRPQHNLVINAGLLRFYDNVRVPYYTPTDHLVYKGFRLALFGSDASGVGVHFSPLENTHLKFGAYQLYENNVEQDDDVQVLEFAVERDLDAINTIGIHAYMLRDHGNGEGGVSILGQGLNSGLSNYNGVFNFDLGNRRYMADVYWLGTTFHGNPLLDQGRFGYNGFAWANAGIVDVQGGQNVDILGFAGNLRLAYKYGRTTNDFLSADMLYTSGDSDNVTDGSYNGVLTGNNWGAPGAVFFGHGLYLLLPHGNVVNRFLGATIDVQNLGYGFTGGALNAAYDVVPNKLRVKGAVGYGIANATPTGGGNVMGTEVNLNVRYTLRVLMDVELHAAYLALGDFYDSPVVNGGVSDRPKDPFTVFATLKWIMF